MVVCGGERLENRRVYIQLVGQGNSWVGVKFHRMVESTHMLWESSARARG